MQLDFVAAGADSAEKDKTKSAKKDDKKGKKEKIEKKDSNSKDWQQVWSIYTVVILTELS